MTEESIVFMFIIGCSTILSYFAYKIGRGNKKMDFWKYNIGDEITTRTVVPGATVTYRIIDRNVWLNYDEETVPAHERSRVKYLLWDIEQATVTEMSEFELDKFLERPSATIKRNVANTLNVTIKKNNTNVPKQINEKSDAVNHPSYYQGKIEVIDFIEDKGLGFNLGNCIKYIARAGKKNPDKLLEDLEKASWYLYREISRIKKESTETQWLPLPKENRNE